MRDCDRGDDTTERQGHAGVIGPFAGFQAVRSAGAVTCDRLERAGRRVGGDAAKAAGLLTSQSSRHVDSLLEGMDVVKGLTGTPVKKK